MISDNISVNERGHLVFAGHDTVELAKKYGTPLYLMDEKKIRQRMRIYKETMAEVFPEGSLPEYASKAFACKQIYRIATEEGIDIDTVSPGEIYTAFSAGFPMERCFFHGTNKSDEDIRFAMEKGVGYFVADNFEEIEAIEEIAGEMGLCQKVILRVTLGIDPHTHKKISTGSEESKFGFSVKTGQALAAAQRLLEYKNIELCGYHCHIGSQIFDSAPFKTAAELIFDFVFEVLQKTGYYPEVLNMGGGFGVPYVESDPKIDYAEKIREVGRVLREECIARGTACPKIFMEPGRSLVADAGMTLYTVGSVKEVKGYRNYISVDGGMTDNPRYALYESQYTVEIANKASESKDFCATVAGRCCESGDLIGEDMPIQKPCRGDILAVCTTGAYNYSMASNYNRVPRPPVVMLTEEGEYLAVKRETLEDICGLDI